MARETYVWCAERKAIVPKTEQRRGPKGPEIITDDHEPFRSMADGKIYDSKSVYRRSLKARGYVEVGNDTKPLWNPDLPKRRPVQEDVKRAMQERGYA